MPDGRRALWVGMVAAVAWMVASAPALSPAFNGPIRGWLVETAGGSPLDPLVRLIAVWTNIALMLASRGTAPDADLWSVAAAELLVAGLPVWMLCAWTRRFARVTPWHRDPMLVATVVWTALLGAGFAPPLLAAITDERTSRADCFVGTPRDRVRCTLATLRAAQEAHHARTGRYFSGQCEALPGVTVGPGVVCSTAGDDLVFTAVASHPDGAAACASQDGFRPCDE